MPRRATVALVLVLGLGLGVGSCSSSDGRTLPPPDAHQTTTSVSTPVVAQPDDG